MAGCDGGLVNRVLYQIHESFGACGLYLRAGSIIGFTVNELFES